MSESKDIFKKFGPSAKHVLIASQKVAQNMNSGIGSEHLLLAMTTTAGSLAYDLLKENSINLDQVKLILSLNNIRTNINKGLSQESKNILVKAGKKAAELDSPFIQSEHILWSILDSSDCRAYQIISRIGISIENFKNQLEDIFNDQKLEDLPPPKAAKGGFDFFGIDPYSMPANFNIANPGLTLQNNPNNSKTPLLDQFGIDLTKHAHNHKLDPVIGREKEINRTIQILCRRNKNNPILVGEPGVGKTAIIEGLAQKIDAKQVPDLLKNKKIYNLDLTMVVAGTMYRGQFEDRLKKILHEVANNKNIILFIDEFHTIIGAGSAEGSMDAANILKPSLARGDIRLIGATTNDEYRRYIEKDSALERRLQIIRISEPTIDESILILHGIKKQYQDHHGLSITDNAISSSVKLAKRYITDRYLPDSAIDLIDEASAAKKISAKANNWNIKITNLEKKINTITKNKEKAAIDQDYQAAALLKTQEIRLQDQLDKLKNEFGSKEKIIVDEIDIAKIVSMWTSIPLDNLIQTQQKKLLQLEKILAKHIIGQEEAITAIAQAIRRSKSGVANPHRPIGTFIFLGPTGVGKTQLARILAKEIYSNENALIKIDMSEFTEKHTIARLIGAPPGYIGYEDAGKLTESVRKNPYSVILFDEIEKANPEIFNILLQIMEDGVLTDAKGIKVNFKNTIIILTSNIGLTELTEQAAIGFKANPKDKIQTLEKYKEMQQIVLEQLKKSFKPELLNRLDKIIVFKPLDKKDIIKIVELQLSELSSRLKNNKINLIVDKKTIEYLAQIGYDPNFGARPIRRKIIDLIETELSDKILSGNLIKNYPISTKLVKDQIKFVQSRRINDH